MQILLPLHDVILQY